MRIQEVKIELQKRVHKRICVRDITFLAACPNYYVICWNVFCLLLLFGPLQFYVEKENAQENGEGCGAP